MFLPYFSKLLDYILSYIYYVELINESAYVKLFTARRNVGGIKFEDVQSFGPIGTHKATIVWLHDIGETSANSVRFARQLGLRNIKWICPTAPRRPVTILGGMETNAWFDIAEISENMQDDEVSLHHAALSIANLFSDHASPNIMIGVGGMGMGAAQALYLASKSCYDTNQRLQIKPRVVIGLKGWLPGWR
ncbi:unnamed protein product [Arabidopsis thaliana]|uniref:Phospholipase/carboxylesterase/thioesterase domain-containing protein n=1 Tax=Arabidopsis thaliana TaxID=3702 RepID=A0A654EH60_ARATH|nr:unnamed protein product [Arabidopsis thaliana]